MKSLELTEKSSGYGAGDRGRTGDVQLGKITLLRKQATYGTRHNSEDSLKSAPIQRSIPKSAYWSVSGALKTDAASSMRGVSA